MRHRHSTLALTLGLLLLPAVASASPIIWNGHSYLAVHTPDGILWANANIAAQALGGHLVTLTSAEENTFVFSLVDEEEYWRQWPDPPQPPDDWLGPWIGAYQPEPGTSEPAGGWAWVTGEPWSFTNWGGGEPNNAAGGEHIAHFWGNGALGGPLVMADTWNDVFDWKMNGYVVEWDYPVPEPTTLLLLGTGLAGLAGRAARRRRR